MKRRCCWVVVVASLVVGNARASIGAEEVVGVASDRITRLQKSLASVEREAEAAKEANDSGAQLLLAEVQRNIRTTLADLQGQPIGRLARIDVHEEDAVVHDSDSERPSVIRTRVRIVAEPDAIAEEHAVEETYRVRRAEARARAPMREHRSPPNRDDDLDRDVDPRHRPHDAHPRGPHDHVHDHAHEHAHADDRAHGHGHAMETVRERGDATGRHPRLERRGGPPTPGPAIKGAGPRRGDLDAAGHLRAAAAHLDSAGYEAMAKKARAESERLRRDAPADGGDRANARIGRAIGDLRRDVDRMQDEIRAMQAQLHRATQRADSRIDDQPSGDQPRRVLAERAESQRRAAIAEAQRAQMEHIEAVHRARLEAEMKKIELMKEEFAQKARMEEIERERRARRNARDAQERDEDDDSAAASAMEEAQERLRDARQREEAVKDRAQSIEKRRRAEEKRRKQIERDRKREEKRRDEKANGRDENEEEEIAPAGEAA